MKTKIITHQKKRIRKVKKVKKMTNITINTKKNVIEMSNAFAKAAKNVGSEEYKTLQEARRDYPNFRVETKKVARKTATNSFKGLTYDYM